MLNPVAVVQIRFFKCNNADKNERAKKNPVQGQKNEEAIKKLERQQMYK